MCPNPVLGLQLPLQPETVMRSQVQLLSTADTDVVETMQERNGLDRRYC